MMKLFRNCMYGCAAGLRAWAIAGIVLLVGMAPVYGETAQKNVVLPGTDDFFLSATGTGDVFRISVWVPDVPAPTEGFPVFYAMDASDHFAPLFATMDRSTMTGQSGVIPGILVAVGYLTQSGWDVTRRTFDLTPPAKTYVQPDAGVERIHGGADVFLDFMEHDLKPAIEAKYRINKNQQTLFGHSYGGLFTLHTLFTRPHMFQRYAASSPSIWFNDRFILSEEKAFTEKLKTQPLPHLVEVQITVGGLEQVLTAAQKTAKDAAKRKAMKAERRMVDNTRELSERLAAFKASGIDVRYHVFEGEDHLSVMPAADARAVTFALRNYE